MTSTEWPEIIPIAEQVPPVPFPTDCLPGWLRHFVRAEAVASQLPEDMVGMLSLSALSTALQGRFNVLADTSGWIEPVTLYTATAMESGERKSHAFKKVFAPILAWESEIAESERPIVSKSQREHRELELAVEKADQRVQKTRSAWMDAKRSDDSGPDAVNAALGDLTVAQNEADELRNELREHELLFETVLLYNDLTPEAAAMRLSEQKGSNIAVLSAEGGVFEVLTGSRYSDKTNLDVFLSGHSADVIRVDRVGRQTERIDRPMITLGVAFQESMLRDLGKVKSLNGRGLLARILYSVPNPMTGYRISDVPGVPAEIVSAYDGGIAQLCASAYVQPPATLITLSDEAQVALRAYRDANELRLREDGDMKDIKNWGSKLPGQLVRIATILAFARTGGVPEEVDVEDFESAFLLGEYLVAHALRAHTLMGLIEISESENKIVKKIRDENLTEFTTREMYRAVNAHRSFTVPEFESALDDLVNMGYLRKVVDSVKPPKYHWIVNPAVCAA